MASPEEIQFAHDRQWLQTVLTECMFTSELCLGVNWVEIGGDLSSLTTSHLLDDTIANQHLVQERLYSNDQKAGYIIAADPNWKPIVIITSSLRDPQLFVLSPDELEGFDDARKAMVDVLRQIKVA